VRREAFFALDVVVLPLLRSAWSEVNEKKSENEKRKYERRGWDKDREAVNEVKWVCREGVAAL